MEDTKKQVTLVCVARLHSDTRYPRFDRLVLMVSIRHDTEMEYRLISPTFLTCALKPYFNYQFDLQCVTRNVDPVYNLDICFLVEMLNVFFFNC